MKRQLARKWVHCVVGLSKQQEMKARSRGIGINDMPELPPIRKTQLYSGAREKLQYASIAAHIVALAHEYLSGFFRTIIPRTLDRPHYEPDADPFALQLIRERVSQLKDMVTCLSTTVKGNHPAFLLWEASYHPLSPLSRKSCWLHNLKMNIPFLNLQMLHRNVIDLEEESPIWMVHDSTSFPKSFIDVGTITYQRGGLIELVKVVDVPVKAKPRH